MFNISSVANDQLTMRPIIKRPQSISSHRMDSRTSSSCDTSLSTHQHSRQALFNQTTIFGCDKYQCDRTYMYIVNSLAARIKKPARNLSSCYENKKIFKINENAVRLDDIEKWWYTENETVPLLGLQQHKEYDDIDLDLFAIHREAQEYNDCSDLQKTLDFFFMQSVLQHIMTYLKDSWFDLTQSQKFVLCFVTNHNPYSLFDHFLWFGYDCLIRSSNEELPTKAAEYNTLVKNLFGILSHKIKKDANDLAVDFGMGFSYSNVLITTCNKHFDKSRRDRMPYTKQFVKAKD